MALFLVRHQHEPDHCPAADPDMGAMLLNYLSRPNVREFGVTIEGEAVVRDEHTMFMILEAASEDRVREFMRPFEDAGEVDVYPASTCVRVVASGGCSAPLPTVDEPDALDPEEACQHAIDEGLVVHRAHPLNCEASIPALIGGVVMPNAHFYVRNHFQIPSLDPSAWTLAVAGLVERPLNLGLRDLMNMQSEARVVTLECAGNGRYALDPPVDGEKWRLGAVSTAEWTGVPLAEVLDRAGVQSSARELVFRGADSGNVDDRPDAIHYERSLAIDTARESQALLAYAMNGEPLPVQHGYPVRLIVPSWYGVASVKWLTHIDAVAPSFDGYYQHDKYWFEVESDGGWAREPVTLQRVRAVITEPGETEDLERGNIAIRGVAWSGAAPIDRVEVRVGGGGWQTARLLGDRQRHSWQWWELLTRVDQPGNTILQARATDMAGRTQPEAPEWNRFGYGNNSIQQLTVRIV